MSWTAKENLLDWMEHERKLEVFQKALVSIWNSHGDGYLQLEGVKFEMPNRASLQEFPMPLKHLVITTNALSLTEIISYISPHAVTLTDLELFLGIGKGSAPCLPWIPPGDTMIPCLPALRRLVLGVTTNYYPALDCGNALNLRQIFLVRTIMIRTLFFRF